MSLTFSTLNDTGSREYATFHAGKIGLRSVISAKRQENSILFIGITSSLYVDLAFILYERSVPDVKKP